MFNVIIIGAKETDNYEFFKEKTIRLLKNKASSGEYITILTIGDDYVTKFAERYKITTQFFGTNWSSYGKEALKYRNESMLQKADAIIFFENNKKDLNMIYNQALKTNRIICKKIKVEFV